MTNYHDVEGLLNDNYNGIPGEFHIDIVRYADAYMEQYQMYTLIMLFNVYNLLGALRIFRVVNWVMLMVERTIGVVMLFMIMLIPMQIGFAFLTLVFVGPYV